MDECPLMSSILVTLGCIEGGPIDEATGIASMLVLRPISLFESEYLEPLPSAA